MQYPHEYSHSLLLDLILVRNCIDIWWYMPLVIPGIILISGMPKFHQKGLSTWGKPKIASWANQTWFPWFTWWKSTMKTSFSRGFPEFFFFICPCHGGSIFFSIFFGKLGRFKPWQTMSFFFHSWNIANSMSMSMSTTAIRLRKKAKFGAVRVVMGVAQSIAGWFTPKKATGKLRKQHRIARYTIRFLEHKSCTSCTSWVSQPVSVPFMSTIFHPSSFLVVVSLSKFNPLIPNVFHPCSITFCPYLTWWFIPLSKWVITLVINGISGGNVHL